MANVVEELVVTPVKRYNKRAEVRHTIVMNDLKGNLLDQCIDQKKTYGSLVNIDSKGRVEFSYENINKIKEEKES